MTFTTFFPPIILQYKSMTGLGKILSSQNLHVYVTYMYSRSILARLMLDRRRLEDAHFQHAILKVDTSPCVVECNRISGRGYNR